VGARCADHVTPFYPQNLALISPTGGGRSVGIVRVRTKAKEFSLVLLSLLLYLGWDRCKLTEGGKNHVPYLKKRFEPRNNKFKNGGF